MTEERRTLSAFALQVLSKRRNGREQANEREVIMSGGARGVALQRIVAAALSLAVLSSPAVAEDCSSADATNCTDSFMKSRLDALLAEDPTSGRIDSRTAGTPWIAQDWASAPWAITQSDTSLQLRTSSRHWDGFSDRLTAMRVEEARLMAPDLVSPKAVVRKDRGLDVWSDIRIEGSGIEGRGMTAANTQGVQGRVGADYRLRKGTVFGLSAELGDEKEEALASSGSAMKIAAYASVKPLSGLTLDARAAWGEESGSFADQAFSATQNVVSARVRGDWSFSKVKLAPALSISQGEEHASLFAGGETRETSTIAFEPRVSRPFALDRGGSIEPFVRYKGEIEIGNTSSGATAESSLSETVGAGMTLVEPERYSLTVSTDVENVDSRADAELKSKLELKIPLK